MTRLDLAWSLAGTLLANLGCSGGVIEDPATSGGGNVGIGTGGATAVACYSPTQNLGTAYEPGAEGCACNPAADVAVCVQGVALICTGTHWSAVEDGPCMPMPGTGGVGNVATGGTSNGGATAVACYSPTQNLGIAYQPGATGCACNAATDASVCAQGVGLICMGSRWMAVIDGPCMPVPGSGGAGNGGSSNGGNGGSGNVGNTGGAVGGTTASTTTCFSPTQNLDMISPGSPNGCACGPSSPSVCARAPYGLICQNGYWNAVWDGPCGTGGRTSIGSGGSSTGSTTAVIRCGARAGNTCLASEYCAYEEGQICGRGDMEATCKPRPQVCDTLYAPVCGCDNKTYSNSCVAAVAGTGVYTNSACTN